MTKQLSIFGGFESAKDLPEPQQARTKVWKMFIDGAARFNPGPSGAGIYVVVDNKPVAQWAFYLGEQRTNNQAEYYALLLGLHCLHREFSGAQDHGDTHRARLIFQPNDSLLIISDSLILVRQIQGLFKVTNPLLVCLHRLAKTLLRDTVYSITHVLRSENSEADALANQGIDKKIAIPTTFLQLIHDHGVPF